MRCLQRMRPAKSAIIGSFAPHGMNGASMAVVRLWCSSLIVLVAITPGIAHAVLITIGMTDLPERPIFLKNLSMTTATRAMYPQSSSRASRKNMTMMSGQKAYYCDNAAYYSRLRGVLKLSDVRFRQALQSIPEKLPAILRRYRQARGQATPAIWRISPRLQL